MIKINSLVFIYLQNPREKFFGRLYELNPHGLHFIGIDQKTFDDWCREINNEEEPTIFPSTSFIPIWRIEKLVLDETQGVFLSFSATFQQKTDLEIESYLPLLSE